MENKKTKIENTLIYYLIESSLKDVERTGWKDWHVKRHRLESVSDHVFATQQLAFAVWSEFDIPVNIDRVIAMLAFHETEEPVIGDLSLASDLKKYKTKMGEIAVTSVLSNMAKKDYVLSLVREFEEQKTPEAKFAKFIDKLECDITSKLYDEDSIIDLNNQENNKSSKIPLVVELLSEGKSFSQMWMGLGRRVYNYPEEFMDILQYAEDNDLHELRDEALEKSKAKVKAFLDTIVKPSQE